ncbi:MAG: restriction endonuclease subunit S [Zhaonellaceae bacterium]
MSRYKRYERYKVSGVEWIGEMPEHWGVKPLKRVFKIINGGTPSSSEESYWNGEIVWVTPNDLSNLTEACIVDTERKITDDGLHNCSARIVPKGSIVISTRAPIGYVAIAGVPLCTNQGCKSLVAIKKVNPKYFYYWMYSISFYLNVLGQGTTFIELSNSNLSMVELLTPSINEQKAVANFLDQKTAEIDDLIADKEKLIELLQEKRQAIITEAVIKGLNPNVKMKDSGIEWIGEIPEHWDVIKLKYVTKLVYGDSLPTENREEGEVDVFGSNGKVGTHNVANTLSPVIIVGRKGSYGKVTYSDKKCFAIDTTYYIDNRCTKSNIKWLYYSLMVLELDKNSQDTGVPGLSREYAYNKYVPVPTVNEQVAIANFLDQKTAEIDSLVTETKNQIEKLKEYRQSLISETVTGKIDVREFQNKNEVIFRNE